MYSSQFSSSQLSLSTTSESDSSEKLSSTSLVSKSSSSLAWLSCLWFSHAVVAQTTKPQGSRIGRTQEHLMSTYWVSFQTVYGYCFEWVWSCDLARFCISYQPLLSLNNLWTHADWNLIEGAAGRFLAFWSDMYPLSLWTPPTSSHVLRWQPLPFWTQLFL